MAGVFAAVYSMVLDTITLERAFFYYWIGKGSYREYGTKPFGGSLHAAVHVFSLALEVKLWSVPHYRTSSYQADILANYKNVAVPGTGIPLSMFASHWMVATWFLVFLYPILCLCAALHHALYLAPSSQASLVVRWASAYHQQLLEPQDWFSFWRINSRVAAWHAWVTSKGGSDYHDYGMENKWDFLQRGLALGVPVSPILKTPKLCIKHRNLEGGMGIFFYENALQGGDWIIQEAISNDAFLKSLLPSNAPLSTFRLLSSSLKGAGVKDAKAEVIAAVFRAGREGALTDHSSVLFDVDVATGRLGRGTRNAQWYVLGPKAWFGSPWGPPPNEMSHPDGSKPLITGKMVPNWDQIKNIVAEAHDKMLPNIPLSGWDVCLTAEHGVCMLEANLSCNFFRASFDQSKYFAFIDTYHRFCEEQEAKPMDASYPKPFPAKSTKTTGPTKTFTGRRRSESGEE